MSYAVLAVIGVVWGILILACPVWFFQARMRLSDLEEEVRHLRKRFDVLEGGEPVIRPIPLAQSAPYKEQVVYQEPEPEALEEFEVFPEEPVLASVQKAAKKGSSFEFNIGAKLPVWIGAICLICAGYFLVKYSIEVGLLGPAVRTVFAGIFGVALVFGGKFIGGQDKIANFERISQGLIGAGLVMLYFTFYAAVNLYDLLPPAAGFGGMVGVTALAVFLSLRHGQAISVFGLIGGLLTPALISSDSPSAAALFSYLAVFSIGSLFVMVRQGWWLLANLVVLGLFGWIGVWGLSHTLVQDRYILILFAMAVVAVVLASTRRYSFAHEVESHDPGISRLNVISMACAFLTLLWLGSQVTLSFFDWSMVGLLSVACVALTYFREPVYGRMLLVKMIADIALFFFWAQHVAAVDMYAVVAGFVAVYGVLPAFIMLRFQPTIRIWSIAQVATSLSVYLVCYYVSWKAGAVHEHAFAAIAFLAAGFNILQIREFRSRLSGANSDWITSIYAFSASAFISLGLMIALPWDYVPMAFALEVLAVVALFNRFRIPFLETIGKILVAVFVLMNFEQIALFMRLVGEAIADERPSQSIEFSMLDTPFFTLGLPALIFGSAFALNARLGQLGSDMSKLLFVVCTALVSACYYYFVRMSLHGDHFLITEAGFFERAMVTGFIVALSVGVYHLFGRYGRFYIKFAALLMHMAFARIIYFDLIVDNPYFSGQENVGEVPILNGVTLVYGLGSLLAIYAAKRMVPIANSESLSGLYKLISLLLLFVFTSLTIRQFFHGGDVHKGIVESFELYSYSIIWLLTSLLLLALGIARNSKNVRIAAMAFMVLTIGKVFLVDAGELTGLYRIFSFLGLGVCLIGLSYFYTKFIAQNTKEETAS